MSARTVVLLAAVCSAAPALAYQQTTASGHGLHWSGSSVTYKVNTSRPSSAPSCAASATADPALDAVQASFATWSNATRAGDSAPCTKLTLVYGGPSTSTATGSGTSGEHLVVFRQGWCSSNPDAVAAGCVGQTRPGTSSDPACNNLFNCFDDTYGGLSKDVLALTTVMYTPSTGVIGDADTEVVDWDGTSGSLQQEPPGGWYWTCSGQTGPHCTSYGQGDCCYMDLQNTVTHETGHFIGLAHPCEITQAAATASGVPVCSGGAMASTTMYPSAPLCETAKRTLDGDDVEGVCAIYGTISSASSKRSSGGCGAGSATPAGLIVLAVAIAALLPRRRRARC